MSKRIAGDKMEYPAKITEIKFVNASDNILTLIKYSKIKLNDVSRTIVTVEKKKRNL